MEEIKAFWEGFKEILNHPLIIGGTSVTFLSIIALLVRLFLSAPNKKQIITIKGDLASVRKNQEQYVTKEQFNSLVGYFAKQNAFNEKLVENIKNESTKAQLKCELAEIESELPKELVIVVEEKPKEKVVTRF